MRYLIALAGVITFEFQVNFVAAQEKFNLDYFESIELGDPDYILKLSNCNITGIAIAKSASLKEEDGSESESLYITNYEHKVFLALRDKIFGIHNFWSKGLNDPRHKSWGEELLKSQISTEARDKTFGICRKAIYDFFDYAYENMMSNE